MIEEWLIDQGNRDLFHQYLDEWEAQHPQYNFDTELGLATIYKKINASIGEDDAVRIPIKRISFNFIFKWFSVAAVILIFFLIGWRKFSTPSLVGYKNRIDAVRKETGEIYEKENVTTAPILVNLPDRSSVLLQPKSKISYSPKQFNKQTREVILSGEAFFEVQKNSNVPFFVYADGLITKVLGTSFFVKSQAYASEVIVKTGKVAVFMHNDRNKQHKLTDKTLNGLVLQENERVTIDQNEYALTEPLQASKETLQLPIQKLSFDFDEAPAIYILETLKKVYHIQIVYNTARLSKCRLTAHLSDEPLLDKIELICIALEAHYVESDGKTIIESAGCK
ncbi:hypothetical protein GCM10028803_48710 [Larkinella knui]